VAHARPLQLDIDRIVAHHQLAFARHGCQSFIILPVLLFKPKLVGTSIRKVLAANLGGEQALDHCENSPRLFVALLQYLKPVLDHNDMSRRVLGFGGFQHQEALAIARDVVVGARHRTRQPRTFEQRLWLPG
jgi:hypothetical protein